MLAAVSTSPPPPSGLTNPTANKNAVAKHARVGSTTASTITTNTTGAANAAGASASTTTEWESVTSYDDGDGDGGWLEVGKRNRTVVTRTVCLFPSLLVTVFHSYNTRTQIKGTESPITRIFGGKFRSTLRAPGQKDSVLVEDWRSLRLDIQVCYLPIFLYELIFNSLLA